jgi:hypothetical protein
MRLRIRPQPLLLLKLPHFLLLRLFRRRRR